MLRRVTSLLFSIAVLSGCQSDPIAGSPQAVALHIYPTGGAFNIGEPFTFSATRLTADSTELGPASQVTWTSTDPAVASITADGRFQARCTGNTTIKAQFAEGSRVLLGQRTVSVNTTGPQCATLATSEQTPSER